MLWSKCAKVQLMSANLRRLATSEHCRCRLMLSPQSEKLPGVNHDLKRWAGFQENTKGIFFIWATTSQTNIVSKLFKLMNEVPKFYSHMAILSAKTKTLKHRKYHKSTKNRHKNQNSYTVLPSCWWCSFVLMNTALILKVQDWN